MVDDTSEEERDGGMSEEGKKRLATIVGPPLYISAYLPHNYKVTHVLHDDYQTISYIEGEDVAGWTLEGYVRPRLESGLWFGLEDITGQDIHPRAVEWSNE